MAEVLRRSSLHQENGGSKDALRKTKKPLMEKRRRARINSCLNDIKSLLLQAFNKDGSQFSKLEKADILEMTVKYLRSVQQAQLSAAVQADHAVTTRYRAGFTECAKETLRYVDNVQVSDSLRNRLSSHLNNCVQAIQHQPPQVTPVYVQIPTYHSDTIPAPQHYATVPQTTPSPISSDSDSYSPRYSVSPPHSNGLLQIPNPEVNDRLQMPKTEIIDRQIIDQRPRLSPIASPISSPVTSNNGQFHPDYTVSYSAPSNYVSSKVCRDVICAERSSNACHHHVGSNSPNDAVWRPW